MSTNMGRLPEEDRGPPRILIAGAGPAGLLAANALKKQGYKCKVFEQDAYTGARPRDWSFGIYWAHDPLKDCLSDELIEKIVREGQVDNRQSSAETVLPIYNSVTGEVLKNIPIPHQIRLHRLNFLKILLEGIDVEYNKRIRSVKSDSTSVTVFFEDGTQEHGDLLIGAEGAHSKVRQYLVGEEAAALKKTPLIATFTMAKLPKETAELSFKAHPRFYAHTLPTGVFWISVIHDAWAGTKPGDWHFMFLSSRPENDDSYDPSSLQGDAILEDLKQRAEDTGEPFRSILQSIPKGTKCWHNRLSYWEPNPWDNRRQTITLIGDAAHPMTYHRGQGLNNAVLDVASLAREIAAKGLKEGVAAYEQEMIPRGKAAVTASLENSLALHDWNGLTQSHLFVSGAKQQTQVIVEELEANR